MATQICPGCNAQMDFDAVFCNECGLAAVASGVVVGVEADPVIGSFPFRGQSEPPPRPETTTRECPLCGEKTDVNAKFCSECTYKLGQQFTAPPPPTPLGVSGTSARPDGETVSSAGDRDGDWRSEVFDDWVVPAVRKRYREGYLYARAIVGAGIAVQVLGVIIGCILVLIGFFAGAAVAGQGGGPLDGGVAAASGIIMGVIPAALGVFFGGILFVFGILIKASGQFLKAQLDSAVNSSPFLNNRDRADMMSLLGPGSTATGIAGGHGSGGIADYGPNPKNRFTAAYAVAATSFLFLPLSLLWTIPVILWALMSTDSRAVRFQVFQCILLNLTAVGAFLLFWLFAMATQSGAAIGFGLVILVAGAIADLVCIIKARADDGFSLPILGDIARQWAFRGAPTNGTN